LQVGTPKHNAAVDRGRAQAEFDPLPAVQTDTGRTNRLAQTALS